MIKKRLTKSWARRFKGTRMIKDRYWSICSRTATSLLPKSLRPKWSEKLLANAYASAGFQNCVLYVFPFPLVQNYYINIKIVSFFFKIGGYFSIPRRRILSYFHFLESMSLVLYPAKYYLCSPSSLPFKWYIKLPKGAPIAQAVLWRRLFVRCRFSAVFEICLAVGELLDYFIKV